MPTQKFIKSLRFSACLGACLLSLGCTPISTVRGNLVSVEDLSVLQPGVTTRTDVLSKLGTPSLRDAFKQNVWIYMGTKTSQYAFFEPEIEEHRVLLLSFKSDDVLEDYRVLSEKELADINFDSTVTPTAGGDFTILQQLIGNIGRFQQPGDSAGQTSRPRE